jgi:hypothetical protein
MKIITKKENPNVIESKRTYKSPNVVVYGHIAKLTQSTGSANGDGGANMMT